MTEETTKERFGKAEKKFFDNLKAFADGGYRFSDEYSLYKQSQQEGFQGYIDGLAQGHKHGYIELPTGVGKTALFISLIKNYLEAANGDENAPRVLIAVPTEKLAVQTAKSIAKFMPEIAKTIETDGDEGKEIDWEKSDIGLQYGKMKHAHKKPKVLITTYQSLARDTADKTYPPSEYGYVIYDEGHVITAPTFGKAVEKFKDSIQLAVSATPEYTETKTVGSRLPHRYFQLTLAEAINRGDLCNVRPAILKTGYRIDESLFQKFMEQQGGTPLNQAQLQQLLNQETRNKAVIETYLRGADPDSGERYFGQNGMIFCTGVKHADSIAEQFKKAMEKPGEGQALKRWLDNEQIELIAPVHGQAKGAWLKKDLLPNKSDDNRQFQGGKEWYTEDEIFDLHERGKILLLASVAKLKWGFDSPRDSLLFDLADRFSKVDATQIDGRAFRLDPENPNKTATVFNLMDENTEELYARYPKMIPIYCAEVIEGADFRPPARRPSAQVRFKEPPPGMEKSLQEAGFDIVTNIDAVRTISRENKANREMATKKAPPKDDWLSAVDLKKAYVGGHEKFVQLISEYAAKKYADLCEAGMPPKDATTTVERDFSGLRTGTSGVASPCVSPMAIEELLLSGKLTQSTNSVPPKHDWFAVSDLRKTHRGADEKKQLLLVEYAEKKHADLCEAGMSPEDASATVERDFVGVRVGSGRPGLCASPEVIKELVASGKLAEKTNDLPSVQAQPKGDWLSSSDLIKKYIGGDSKLRRIMAEYAAEKRADLCKEGMSPEEALATVERDFVGVRVSFGRPGLCASAMVIDELVASGKLKSKEEKCPPKANWFSGADLMKAYVGKSTKFNQLFIAFKAEKQASLCAEGMSPAEAAATIERDFIGMRNCGNIEALCVSPNVVAELEQAGKLVRAVESDVAQTFAEKVGQRDIAPQSDHLKRTGRVLGAGES